MSIVAKLCWVTNDHSFLVSPEGVWDHLAILRHLEMLVKTLQEHVTGIES